MIRYFNIVQALCRSAMANPNDAIVHQINRLKESLEKDGYEKEAKSLEGILTAAQAAVDMSPSKLQQSFVLAAGEELTKKTQVPVDKETSTPLAEIYFPADLPDDMPLFDDDIRSAILSIINEWN